MFLFMVKISCYFRYTQFKKDQNMKKILLACLLVLCCAAFSMAQNTPTVKLQTTMGDIIIELDSDKAPLTVKNFLDYVNSGFYNGTIFHRVIDGFMIQGGGMDKNMREKPTNPSIVNEGKNGLKNDTYTIAMARRSAPDSATAQFFINVNDNDPLNYPSPDGHGYAVFGKVVKGQDVVDKIKAVKTTSRQSHDDVPVTVVEIIKASVI